MQLREAQQTLLFLALLCLGAAALSTSTITLKGSCEVVSRPHRLFVSNVPLQQMLVRNTDRPMLYLFIHANYEKLSCTTNRN